MFKKKHENYKELVMRLAKTDFKLRYHGSTLGYLWAILRPLLMFTILNFVFSSIFNFKNSGTPYYPLELLTGILMFQFFSEGTINGMNAFLSKAQLVTKIYIPRWTIILGSSVNALFIYGMNLIVLSVFFIIYGVTPSIPAILMFFFFSFLLYVLIVAFSLLTAPLLVRFRDLSMIWEVLLQVLMYASPIIYPLSMMPEYIQKVMLFNPLAFIIHFSKRGLIENYFTNLHNILYLIIGVVGIFLISFLIYKKTEKRIAEEI
jgi:ABC-type polysaccharide/polyol phosphate export permease